MGNCVDVETDGQPDVLAVGDDGNVGTAVQGTCTQAGDDEDGLAVPFLVDNTPIDLNVQVEYPSTTPASEFIINGASVGTGWSETRIGNCNSWDSGGARRLTCTNWDWNTTQSLGFDFTVPGFVDSTLYCEYNVNVSTVGQRGFTVSLDGTTNIGSIDATTSGLQTLNFTVGSSFTTIQLRQTLSFSEAAEFDTDNMSLTCSTAVGPDAVLAGWYDSTGDGDFADAGDVIPPDTGVANGTSGIETITMPAISTNVLHEQLGCRTSLRMRLSSDVINVPGSWYAGGVPNYTGFAGDGEVEDYVLTCDGFEADYGDHFETTNYDTDLISNGPRHYFPSPPANFLGDCVDTENNGQDSIAANGDNGNQAGAAVSTYGSCGGSGDEDGVAMNDRKWGDGQGSVDVNVTGSGCVVAWADWNGDGQFTGSLNDGVSNVNEFLFAIDASSGSNPTTQTFAAPLSAGDGGTYVYPSNLNTRYRLFEGTCASLGGPGAVAPRFVGNAVGGEVEDYQWGFNPTAVTLNTFTADSSSSVSISFVVLIGLVLLGGSVFLMLRRKYSVG